MHLLPSRSDMILSGIIISPYDEAGVRMLTSFCPDLPFDLDRCTRSGGPSSLKPEEPSDLASKASPKSFSMNSGTSLRNWLEELIRDRGRAGELTLNYYTALRSRASPVNLPCTNRARGPWNKLLIKAVSRFQSISGMDLFVAM